MKKIIKKVTILSLIICIFVSLFNIGKVLAEEPSFILSDARIIDKSDGVDASISSFDGESLELDSIFHKLNDFSNCKLTIKNNTDTKYKLILVSDNSGDNYLDYEYEYNKDQSVSPNNTIDVNMKSIYKNELDDINNRNQKDEFIITFIFEDDKGNIDDGTIIINPDTHTIAGVSIWNYILVISICLLLLIIIKSKKKKKALLLLMVLTPFVVKAVSPSLQINVTNKVELMDKLIINKNINGEITSEIINYNTKLEEPAAPEIEGYNFIGWYQDDELFDFSKEITEDTTITAKYSLKDYRITYNLDGGTVSGNPETYNIETESFDLKNPEKQGYTFSGWTGSNGENLQTRVTIEKGSTGDKTYTAHFSPNQNTHYKVVHKYTKLNGDYEVVNEDLYGPTGTTVTPATKPKNGFNNPQEQSLEITGDGEASIDYIYTRIEYQLTINNIEDVDTTFENGYYPFETPIVMTAKDKDYYEFVKWSNGITTKTLAFGITEDTTVEPVYTPKEYTITFDAQGGVDVNPITKTYNTELGTLPETVRQNYKFDGWFTEAEDGEEISETTLVTGNITYYAHWTQITCKSATSLHYEYCTRTEHGCFQAGYHENGSIKDDTIVYGTIPNSETITPGYAYDCDVNGDGTYDAATERFYYLTTNGDNAVLISHTDFEGENGQMNVNNYSYEEIYDELPTSEQWSNLPIKFNGKPARIPTYEELKQACGKDRLNYTGALDVCTYLLENSRFADPTHSQEGIWLEKINGVTYRYHTNTRQVTHHTQVNTVRPVIEVPLTQFDDKYYELIEKTVTFDAQGGTSSEESRTVEAYTAIGTLPTVNREEYYFDGWFTESTGGKKITDYSIITDDITIYAQWEKADIARIGHKYYPSIEKAVEHVPTDGTETTITILKDCSAEATIQEGQNIVFDIQENTIRNKTEQPIITNNGTLKIMNGTITTNGTTAAFNNNDDGTLIMTGGSILATNTKQAIYNDGGTVEISGDSYLRSTSNQRAAVQNINDGNMTIKGGTIISTRFSGVVNTANLIIGEEDGTHNTSSLIIQGKKYGVTTDRNISMYDGILKGETDSIDNQEFIVNFETNHTLKTGTEDSFKTLYFEQQ